MYIMKNNFSANHTNFLLYTSATGDVKADVYLKDETVWLTQRSMASLFGVKVPAINKHLKNILDSGELNEDSVISILETTATDGKKYKTKFYNLDAIVSVGYRVNSYQATQFRIWATKTLKEFIIKGFVLDDERLKQGNQVFGKDYFDELLERIREIRASERRFYQKITDILPIYTPSRQIMIKTLLLPKSFSPQSKTSCIGPSQEKRLLKSFMIQRMRLKSTWD